MQSFHLRTQEHHGITWIDIANPTKDQIDQALADRSLHPLHLDASLLTGHLPQVEKEADYVFLLLHLPDYNQAAQKIVAKPVAIFLAKDYLITIHRGNVTPIRHLFDECERDDSIRDQYFRQSSGYLLYTVLDGLLREAADLVQPILQRLDKIEDIVFDDRVAAPYEIGQLRQRIIKLSRLMEFLRTVLEDLAPHIDSYTGENLARYYHSTARAAQKLSLMLEEAKETIEIFKDADYTASTEKTNQALAILTIIFTLTIPATVIGSVYGMNIPLPGGIEAGTWTFWGPYTTLMLALAGSVIPAGLMAWYFKRKKWL